MIYIDSDCDVCKLFNTDDDNEERPQSSYINARLISGEPPQVEDPCNKAWRIPDPKPLDPPYKPKEDIKDHRNLTHKDAPNQHDIQAITGLQEALDSKLNIEDVYLLDTSEGTTVVIGDTSFTIFESGYIEENYYDVDEINALLAEKQDNLIAGEGISIDLDSQGRPVISNTNVSAVWGNIQGTITDQTDLINYINEFGGKIDSITVNGIEVPIVNKVVNIEVPTKTSDLINDSGFITNAVNDLANYYLKTETYTKQEVDDIVATVSSLKLEVVEQLPTHDISTSTIYLVPTHTGEANNIYEEYIYVNNNWESIGSTQADLTNYYTKSEVDNLLNNKQDVLTAGTNIAITNNVISTADTLYFDVIDCGKAPGPVDGV